jgi:nitrogen fixation protein FixH
MTKSFTGRHMTFAMVAFFMIVIGVNTVMAVAATRTFGGKVVDNSYVASQKFNRWLAEARAQRAAGWQAGFGSDGGLVSVDTRPGTVLSATAAHPLGRVPERSLTFVERAPGHFVARQPLAPGRWQIRLDARRGSDRASFVQDMRL